jgi:hypothetical protein
LLLAPRKSRKLVTRLTLILSIVRRLEFYNATQGNFIDTVLGRLHGSGGISPNGIVGRLKSDVRELLRVCLRSAIRDNIRDPAIRWHYAVANEGLKVEASLSKSTIHARLARRPNLTPLCLRRLGNRSLHDRTENIDHVSSPLGVTRWNCSHIPKAGNKTKPEGAETSAHFAHPNASKKKQ